jgi:Spy/CpxP family protein refolding chaperone
VKRFTTVAALMFALCIPATAATLADAQQSDAKQSDQVESWQQEFDAVCGKTQDAMSLTAEQLKSLVQRCDALEPRIEKLDETRRKVYLRRLKQCRGLYAYVLESKNVDSKSGNK